jgi:hypothetical protein
LTNIAIPQHRSGLNAFTNSPRSTEVLTIVSFGASCQPLVSVYKPLWSRLAFLATLSFKPPSSPPSTRLLALSLSASCGHRVSDSVCDSPPIINSCLPYYTLIIDYCSRCHLTSIACSRDMVSHHRQQPPLYQSTVYSSRHIVYLPSSCPLVHLHVLEPTHRQPKQLFRHTAADLLTDQNTPHISLGLDLNACNELDFE